MEWFLRSFLIISRFILVKKLKANNRKGWKIIFYWQSVPYFSNIVFIFHKLFLPTFSYFYSPNFIKKYIFRYSRTLGCAIHPHAHPEKWIWSFWMCFQYPNLSLCILLTFDVTIYILLLFLIFSLPLISYCCTSKATFTKFQSKVYLWTDSKIFWLFFCLFKLILNH